MCFGANPIDNGHQPLLQKKAAVRRVNSLDSLVVGREESRRLNTREADRHYLADATFGVTYRARTHEVQVLTCPAVAR